MSAKTQVIISSELNGELHSVCVTDLVTANNLITYKGAGVVQRHCLDLVKDQMIISSVKESPIINIWSFERKDQLHQKIICPNKVTAIKMTSDGKFCLVAINTALYIWQTSTGYLLSILEKHYQKITCIATSEDDTYFITGGDDGIAMIWSLTRCVALTDKDTIDSNWSAKDPIHKWSDHTNAITEVCIGWGQPDTHCLTCSTDQTCRIYELHSGVLMATIVFETPLWSVVMDSIESSFFVGGEDSNIYETKLCKRPSNAAQKPIEPQFKGHESAVTCLAVSIDGLALISGSNDNTIKIWHIISKQCMRTINNKGPVSNVLVVPFPSGLFLNQKPKIAIKPFKRTLIQDLWNDADNEIVIDITNGRDRRLELSFMKGFEKELTSVADDSLEDKESEEMSKQLNELKKINSRIYNYSVDAIFKSIP